MTSPHRDVVALDALAPATHAGAALAARLTAILATLGLVVRALPEAARIPATSAGLPGDHLSPGLYLAVDGDAVVLAWHVADHAAEYERPEDVRPAGLDAEALIDGLVATLRGVGTVGPLAERIDAPSSFRPAFEVTWPETSDLLAVVVEEVPAAVSV